MPISPSQSVSRSVISGGAAARRFVLHKLFLIPIYVVATTPPPLPPSASFFLRPAVIRAQHTHCNQGILICCTSESTERGRPPTMMRHKLLFVRCFFELREGQKCQVFAGERERSSHCCRDCRVIYAIAISLNTLHHCTQGACCMIRRYVPQCQPNRTRRARESQQSINGTCHQVCQASWYAQHDVRCAGCTWYVPGTRVSYILTSYTSEYSYQWTREYRVYCCCRKNHSYLRATTFAACQQPYRLCCCLLLTSHFII